MILNKKNDKNSAGSTSRNQRLMLRMVTSYSVFMVIILILSFLVYHSTAKNVRNSYNKNVQSAFVSNVELFEKDLDIMEVYCRQLLQNENFRNIMLKSTDYPYFSELGNAVSNTLAIDVYPESLLPIKEVFCYLKNSDYIINPSYFTSSSRYYSWVKRYSSNNYVNWLEALTNSDCYYRFLPMDDFASNFDNTYYMYIVDLDDLYYLKTDAVVCFVMNQNDIASLFNSITDETTGSLLIIDEKKEMLFTSGKPYEEGWISTGDVTSLKYSNEFASYSVKNKSIKNMITFGYYQSPNTGYHYYYSFPAFETSGQMYIKTFQYLLLAVIAFLAGSWLIILLSKRNVQPIIDLGNELEDAKVAQTQLQEVVDSQRPIICRSYVRQLLLGMVTSEEEISYIQSYLHLPKEHTFFNGLYVVAYNNTGISSENIPVTDPCEENLEFNQIITDALKQFFGESLYYFIPADRTFGILLNCSESEENNFLFEVHQKIVQIHNYLLDTYGIWLFAGVGKNTDDLMNAWESYQQATEAASYISKNYFFFPYEFIKKDSRAFYYPPELSTKLIHFITSGNTPQVLELFNLIHQENIEERSLPVHILKFLLSDIRNTLLKARFALPDTVPDEVCQSLDEQFNQHVTFKLCEDIALSLCKLFETPTEETNLIDTIEKYIEDNYQDPSMGLNKIADEFQISETYFSHMFKEKTGVNFSTYLENIRMSEAARLIKETNISLNELYISVGYNNVNTFRRAFKKTYGVTPSSMRDGK